jgi:hypothetical protein
MSQVCNFFHSTQLWDLLRPHLEPNCCKSSPVHHLPLSSTTPPRSNLHVEVLANLINSTRFPYSHVLPHTMDHPCGAQTRIKPTSHPPPRTHKTKPSTQAPSPQNKSTLTTNITTISRLPIPLSTHLPTSKETTRRPDLISQTLNPLES